MKSDNITSKKRKSIDNLGFISVLHAQEAEFLSILI